MNTSRIRDILSKSPYLALVETNVYDIPQRLREIDPGYFVVWNNKDKHFEVHNIDNLGGTLAFVVSYDELDYRTIEHCRRTYIGYHGDKILSGIEERNRLFEEERKKKLKNDLEAAAKESVSAFKLDANRLDLHEGYNTTTVIKNNPLTKKVDKVES